MSQQKNSTNYVIKQCKNCNVQFSGHINSGYCSDECRKEYSDKVTLNRKIAKSKLKYDDTADPNSFVECAICGYRSPDIGSHILIHSINSEEYKILHGPVVCSNKINAVLGENNPAYNHGGRLSPFSKNFVKYKGDDYIEDLKRKAQVTKNDNNNNNTKIEYYTSRGMTEEEANMALAERQRTFTLDKCISIYGDEIGKQIWLDRQERWQSVLNLKSKEEIEDINKRKSSKVNYKTLWNNDLDIPGNFYIIQVDENLYKIGITSKKSIYKRYKKKILDQYRIIKFESVESINHAFQIEQLLKDNYLHTIRMRNYPFGWTEIIEETDLTVLIDLYKKLLDPVYALDKFNERFK